ncbi:transposase [Streptomyces sp. NPDC058794]|uniref:transposase n=1 Tax=Streptomyces sp. NPDC058794 TaxID=3346636 RepID=UPI003683D5CB
MGYSSGRRSTRRLNYSGDRQANAALHRIVFTRLRHDPRTQAYYERRTQEGKTRREIIRCLKRYAAREVFNPVRPVPRPPRYRGVPSTCPARRHDQAAPTWLVSRSSIARNQGSVSPGSSGRWP